MTEKEVNEYMTELLQGKRKIDGMEKRALDGFMKLGEDIEKAKSRLMEAQKEIEQISTHIQRAHGAREAYVNLLITSERERRERKHNVREAVSDSLNELKKAMGADKLELLDNEKNVVDSSEG